LIEFNVLNPQTIIRFWKPDFDTKSFIFGVKAQMEYSKDQRESILDEMFIFIFIGGLALVGIILLNVVSKLMTGLSLGDRIKKELNKKKKAFFFNGAIRSYSVTFIKLGIASSIQIIMLVSDSPFIKEEERVMSICIFTCLVVSIAVSYIFVLYNRNSVDSTEFKERFGNLHTGIHLRRNKYNIYYFPNFLLRRFIFFLLPIVLTNHPAQQLQVLLFTTVFYIIYLDGSTRFASMDDNFLNGINDFFCIIQIYHFMCFT